VAGPSSRSGGSSDELPSVALRVKVYVGYHPIAKQRHRLSKIIPAGPTADRSAGASPGRPDARGRSDAPEPADEGNGRPAAGALPRPVRRRRDHPQPLPRLRPHPHLAFLGWLKARAFNADIFGSFYAELRRCRQASPPVAPKPSPTLPRQQQAVRIVNESWWQDRDRGSTAYCAESFAVDRPVLHLKSRSETVAATGSPSRQISLAAGPNH
jgi:hypothetical protein